MLDCTLLAVVVVFLHPHRWSIVVEVANRQPADYPIQSVVTITSHYASLTGSFDSKELPAFRQFYSDSLCLSLNESRHPLVLFQELSFLLVRRYLHLSD